MLWVVLSHAMRQARNKAHGSKTSLSAAEFSHVMGSVAWSGAEAWTRIPCWSWASPNCTSSSGSSLVALVKGVLKVALQWRTGAIRGLRDCRANTFARTCLKNPKDSAQIHGWLVSLEASAKKGAATANYSFFKLCSLCSELEAAKPTRELMMIDEPCAHVIPRLLSSVFVLFSSPHHSPPKVPATFCRRT